MVIDKTTMLKTTIMFLPTIFSDISTLVQNIRIVKTSILCSSYIKLTKYIMHEYNLKKQVK